MIKISVIICSHNPRASYLERTLGALKSQDFQSNEWELLLIDNASGTPLVENWDLSWHRFARHVREDELGLTPARLRGINESQGEVLVFVDDDNVLAPNYLTEALKISSTMPWLGAWGGHIQGEFENEVPDFAKEFIQYLALRDIKTARWACDHGMGAIPFAPCGAGLCVNRQVARTYAARLTSDPRFLALDRRGLKLSSCGDTDMALTACDLGLAVGVLPQLKMLHLIPASRLEKEYLINLVLGVDDSLKILQELRCGTYPRTNQKCSALRSILNRALRVWRKLRGNWTASDEFRWQISKGRLSASN